MIDETHVEQRVKIIRKESIGQYSWDSNHLNNWTTASLKTILNEGEYYTNQLQNKSKETIEEVSWNIGNYPNPYTFASSLWYTYERRDNQSEKYPNTWTGNVGIPYLSDAVFATSEEENNSRKECFNKVLLNAFFPCVSYNWFFIKKESQWTITPCDSGATAFRININTMGHYQTTDSNPVHPSAYLKNTVKITSGRGTESDPFNLNIIL